MHPSFVWGVLFAVAWRSLAGHPGFPLRLVRGRNPPRTYTLEPGAFQVLAANLSCPGAPEAIAWSLSGPGAMAVEPGEASVRFRAPRAGKSVSRITATLKADPSQRVVYTLRVRRNPHPPPPPEVDCLPLLTYLPSERMQGVCNNCWVWATTAALEMEMNVKYGIRDRLSIQYFNDIYAQMAPEGAGDPCAPNTLGAVIDTYNRHRLMVPWSNPHAEYRDGDGRCRSRASIGLFPHYRVRNLGLASIPTDLWSAEEVIEEVKHRLSRKHPVLFKRGGHFVVIVGYRDALGESDPRRRAWKILDSSGVRPDAPDCVYWLPIRSLDYHQQDGLRQPTYAFHYVSDLRLDLQPLALPAPTVFAEKVDLRVGDPLNLVAAVAGRPPVIYQWLKGGRALVGQTAATLVLPKATLEDAGPYSVRVGNRAGDGCSPPVSISVKAHGRLRP